MDIFNIACLSCNRWIKRDVYESPGEAIKKETKCKFGCKEPKITVYP